MTADDRIRCPRCEGADIRHSLQRGMLDAVMAEFGRSPRRCRFCEKRFYVNVDNPGAGAGNAGHHTDHHT